MASKAAILLLVVVAGLAYLLYEPIPKGYSPASSIKLRILAATVKSIQFLADTAERVSPLSGVGIRRAACRLAASSQPSDAVRAYDTEFDGVAVRVYEPAGKHKGSLPGIVYYHGGGFVVCDVESFDRLIRKLSELTNTVIASVNYRLAPEHTYPAAHDDCLAATKFFIKNSKRFHVDPNRIAVAGDSAGGNLAATVALMLRDANFTPAVKLQVLIYPTVQTVDLLLPSMVDNKIDPGIKTYEISYYYSIYLNVFEHRALLESNSHVPAAVRQKLSTSYINIDNLPSEYTAHFQPHKSKNGNQQLWAKIKSAMLNPYFAPLLAPSLAGLPPAYVYTCEHDVLRDDGFLYAQRLREAGVQVEHYNDPLGFHTNILLAMDWPEVDASIKRIAEYIAANL